MIATRKQRALMKIRIACRGEQNPAYRLTRYYLFSAQSVFHHELGTRSWCGRHLESFPLLPVSSEYLPEFLARKTHNVSRRLKTDWHDSHTIAYIQQACAKMTAVKIIVITWTTAYSHVPV